MKTLTLSKKATKKKRLDETAVDYKTLISGDCLIRNEAGTPQILYLEAQDDLAPLSKALRLIRYEKSGRTGGLPTTSRTFGYQPRVVLRRDFCGAASLNSEDSRTYELIQDAARIANFYYRLYNPSLAEYHEALVGNPTMQKWHMRGTPFTSGIINKNNQLRYHFDSGNIKGVWSAMFVFKQGVAGGHLSCPEYDIGFELKNNSLLLFDGQSILHGVTPITFLTPASYRLSIVFYSLAGMWKCLSPEDELARIRKVRTGRETRRAAQ